MTCARIKHDTADKFGTCGKRRIQRYRCRSCNCTFAGAPVKTLANHRVAIALNMAWYNFCRVHSTLRVTPAMQSGLADHIWTIPELLAIPVHAQTERSPWKET